MAMATNCDGAGSLRIAGVSGGSTSGTTAASTTAALGRERSAVSSLPTMRLGGSPESFGESTGTTNSSPHHSTCSCVCGDSIADSDC